jgi:hypothetical protein
VIYKIYTKYGETGLNKIKEYSQEYNLSQEEIYNQFVKMGISKIIIKSQIILIAYQNSERIKI